MDSHLKDRPPFLAQALDSCKGMVGRAFFFLFSFLASFWQVWGLSIYLPSFWSTRVLSIHLSRSWLALSPFIFLAFGMLIVRTSPPGHLGQWGRIPGALTDCDSNSPLQNSASL